MAVLAPFAAEHGGDRVADGADVGQADQPFVVEAAQRLAHGGGRDREVLGQGGFNAVNDYHKTDEEYVYALAEALRHEYLAIYECEVAGACFSADRGDEVDTASGCRFGRSSHRPSDPMLRPMLVKLARCSLATSHTMSQISRSP
jgi:hypothetical protein